MHYSLKSNYLLFILFSAIHKEIGLFIIFRPSLFTIHYFFAHYSIFIIKKHYSLIIIPHPDPRVSDYMELSCRQADPKPGFIQQPTSSIKDVFKKNPERQSRLAMSPFLS